MAGYPEIAGVVADPGRLGALAAYGVLDTPTEQDFDDLAHLAAELCGAPVALISFVASDRQWFKARVGFAPCETDLDRSVCRFVLVEPDLMVIPDLRQDPRTANNPLVIGDPSIRFYAGAPLRTPHGEVLGSLCVIDTEPRPEGLSARQADSLRRIAREVMAQLELRRIVSQREQVVERLGHDNRALALSEAHWRGLFEDLQEGLIVGEAVRGSDGRIVDWRYVEVNGAWGDLLGIDPKGAIGRTVTEVLPGVEPEWIDVAEVVDTGETLTFTRQIGEQGRWYDGRASALGSDLFAILFLDVTDRVGTARAMAESAAKKLALAELADCLRAAQDAAAMSYVAASIMGRTLGACRAGYGVVDARTDSLTMASDWCAPGFVSLKGTHSFGDYGAYVEELRQGRSVDVSDVSHSPYTTGRLAAFEALGVSAFYNVPVMEGGQLVALCFVHFDRPHAITPEDHAFVRAVADRTRVGIARLDAENRQAVLNGEISHRLKNILAMVQSIAAQTLRKRAEPEAIQNFDRRLAALSKAQDILLQSEWRSANLADLVREVLDLAGAEGRYETDGPDVRLGSQAALSTSLLLHELETNAQKYGALSRPEGRVVIGWRVAGSERDAELFLSWKEIGGPPAGTPTRTGFGSRLLKLGLGGTGGADLSFGEDGFSASFRAPLRQIEHP